MLKKKSNLSNATFFHGGKQVKIKGRRLFSSGSDEKNFKQTRSCKGLSLKNSSETENTTSFTDLTDQSAGPSVVNEPASKVLCPVHINSELSVNLVTKPDGTQLNRVSPPESILSNTQTKEEVFSIGISMKMDTNLGTKVDKFSRDFIFKGVYQTFDLAEKISSQEKFVKDVDREGVEILSRKISYHLKTLQDLNSKLQELENRKIVLLKKKTRIEAEMLKVEDRCDALTSRIADLEKSLEQGKKDEHLIRTEIHEIGQEKIRAPEDLKKHFQAIFVSLDSFMQAD
ncbi:hypothetical protein ACH5RR_029372 [Cinchona calisaya]|uniref:Uncharacterized protein n=1 Tax=Cinchona calisaya TaxID=153742 RepID=A0ABD2YSX0_9GENT